MIAASENLFQQLWAAPSRRQDPYPVYRQLRELAPVHRGEREGVWYAFGYDACRELLTDPRVGHDEHLLGALRRVPAEARARLERRLDLQRRTGLSTLRVNPPAHTRARNVVRGTFSPARVATMRADVTALVDASLDELAGAGEPDLVHDFAVPLTVSVMGRLIGIPPEERDRFHAPFVAGGELYLSPDPSDDELARAERTLIGIEEVLRAAIAARRAEPGDDVLSVLVTAEANGHEELDDATVMARAMVLFLAGFVSTAHMITNGLLALFRHPEQMERLWHNGDLVVPAVEEILRWDSPFQWVRRTLFEDVDVGGVSMRRGDDVTIVLGAANRDPARFPDPDRFDVARKDNKALGFGWGIHHCLGAALARLEGQIVFERLRQRYRMELADPDPPLAPSPMSGTLRGVASLRVRLTPLS